MQRHARLTHPRQLRRPTKDHLQSRFVPSILCCKQVGHPRRRAAIVPWTFFVPPKTEKLSTRVLGGRSPREYTILVHHKAGTTSWRALDFWLNQSQVRG